MYTQHKNRVKQVRSNKYNTKRTITVTVTTSGQVMKQPEESMTRNGSSVDNQIKDFLKETKYSAHTWFSSKSFQDLIYTTRHKGVIVVVGASERAVNSICSC